MNTAFLPPKSRSLRPLTRYLAAACLPIGATFTMASCGLLSRATPPECECDAALTKLVLNEPVAGGAGLYGLVVNYGGHPLCDNGDLCVNDDLPPGLTCDPSDPAYGTSSPVNPDWTCTCTGGSHVRCCLNADLPTSPTTLPVVYVPVLVAQDAPASVKNCASIVQLHGTFADNNEKNDKSCVESRVQKRKVDLTLEKSHDLPLVHGGEGVFHLVVSNLGDGPATGFTVTDILPAGFHFAGTTSPGWTCTSVVEAGGLHHETVTCAFAGTLSPATSTSLDLGVDLGGQETFHPKEDQNCATVAAKGDIHPGNDSDCDPYCIDVQTHLLSGVDDGFNNGNGTESPAPSPYVQGWIAANYAFSDVRDYDVATSNRYFATTFTDLAPPPGQALCGATVTLRVKCDDTNDAVLLRFTDENGVDLPQAWSHFLETAPFNAPCFGGTSTLITLDLANLPPDQNGTTNLLPGLAAHGFLDVLVQDDTAVDYVSLDVAYCCQ